MDRITNIEIAGTTYPLNFSIKASEALDERYEGIENVPKVLSDENAMKVMKEVVWILAILIEEGVEYKEIVLNEEVKGITEKQLKVVLCPAELQEMSTVILRAITAGMNREVEIEPSPKNEETKQNE